jgi:YD repeat-containing protein
VLLAAAMAWLAAPRAGAMPCHGYTIGTSCGDGDDPPPPDSCGGPPGNDGAGSSGPDSLGGSRCGSCSGGGNGGPRILGMPAYRISEPFISLQIEDLPSPGYAPGRCPTLNTGFRVFYRQRAFAQEYDQIFGLGSGWSCSYRAYLADLGRGHIRAHRGGAGYLDYQLDSPQFRDGSIVSSIPGGGYEIEYPDGAKERFLVPFVTSDNYTLYFLSARLDPAGNGLTFNYSTNASLIRLTSVSDPGGLSTALYYDDPTFTNQITRVVDPFNRTNFFLYDGASGSLTGTVDTIGLTNSFVYYPGANSAWITNMITPYGTTAFRFGGVNATNDTLNASGSVVSRWAEVTLPNGGKELYLFRSDCSGFLSSSNWPSPVTSPLDNTFDDALHNLNNSFRWGAMQYGHLSTSDPDSLTTGDYFLGRLRHWLTTAGGLVTTALAIERAGSPDGVAEGQVTRYDYDGKGDYNTEVGTNNLPSFAALILPDGSTRFTRYWRGVHSQVTQDTSTYSKTDGTVGLRTNTYNYAGNNVDLVQWVGPNGEQVVSNYFNGYHQPLASSDALNQLTTFTYNGNQQLTSRTGPSGLIVTNTFYPSGTYQDWLLSRVETDGTLTFHTNGYTYANGLVASRADERGLVVSNFWDNLERLTGIRYPEGTNFSTMSNVFTCLDLTATKDRLDHWSYAGFNSVRQKLAETNANGAITRYGYCDCGALLFLTNAWNSAVQQVTTNSYDFQGNRTCTSAADGYNVTNWFDALGRVYITGDGAAYKWFYFNNQGLTTNVSKATGTAQATTFDSEDRPLYVTDANGVTVTNSHDPVGRLLSLAHPDGGVETFGYSARGLIAYTNQIGASNFFTYDAAGRKTYETNANGEVIHYTYNAAGDLLTLTDGKNHLVQLREFWRGAERHIGSHIV